MKSDFSIASSQVVLTDASGMPEMAAAIITVKQNLIAHIERIEQAKYAQELSKFKLESHQTNHTFSDFGDKIISPAWINAHTHLAMNLFRGLAIETQVAGNLVYDLFFGLESHLKPEDVRAFSRIGAYDCLLSGTALVWDHYYHAEAAAQGISDTGMCAVVAPTLQDISGPGHRSWEKNLAETLDIHGNIALQNKGIHAALGPHATDTVSPALWQKIQSTALKNGLPVHVHLAQSPEEVEFCFQHYQLSPAAFLHSTGLLSSNVNCLLVHNIYFSKSDFQFLSPERHTLVFCPFSQMVFHFPAAILEWERQQIPWCVATDCAASNDTMNVQRELAYVGGAVAQSLSFSQSYKAFVQNGTAAHAAAANAERISCTPLQNQFSSAQFLLNKVWSIPGRVHSHFKSGILQVGALANIAIWDPRHPHLWPTHSPLRSLAMSDCAPALHALISNGKWIGKTGDFQRSLVDSSEYQNALSEAQARLSELRKRAGI